MTPHRRGIMLVDMLVVVMLVSAAMVVASQLTVEIFRQHRDVPAKEASILRSQAKIAQLRRLVWNASAITPIDDGVRLIRNGKSTDWTHPGMTVRLDGPVLLANFGDGEVRCVSQVMLANGGRP